MEGQKALVPYTGGGSVVLYQESEAKKHKPRPKVALDPETERAWKLLMGKEVSEDLEGTDKEMEKWWEEERNVFRGRADSFIARMHLVQGTIHHTPNIKYQEAQNMLILYTPVSLQVMIIDNCHTMFLYIFEFECMELKV